ncbi:MAG: aquaporin Z [Microcoleaceae cyanobacterium]
MPISKRCIAEFIGTFWLVFGGCGSAVLAANFPADQAANNPLGIAFVGVSLAFGLTVLTMAYAVGHISGGHFNPAVSFGLWAGKRFSGGDLLPYIASQVLGAILGSVVLWIVAGEITDGGLAANGYGVHSPGGYAIMSGLVIEIVLTFMFLMIILGSTDRRAPQGLAPVAIGLGLTLIHLISIPVTNTSVNPARSTGPALVSLFGGVSWPLAQLWLFWVAPIIGAIIAGYVYSGVFEEPVVERELKTSREV